MTMLMLTAKQPCLAVSISIVTRCPRTWATALAACLYGGLGAWCGSMRLVMELRAMLHLRDALARPAPSGGSGQGVEAAQLVHFPLHEPGVAMHCGRRERSFVIQTDVPPLFVINSVLCKR